MEKEQKSNEKENVVIDDFDFSLIADFFKRIERQGPGGDRETRLAASLIPSFGRHIRVADLGCGSGHQTAVLAKEFDCEIDAVDLLPEMMESLTERCKRERLTSIINPVQASMDNLPFKEESHDLIWAEGSIFIMGYENGLKYWHRFLKKGGFIAVSESSWLSNRRPKNMSWINDNLPEIDSIENKIRQMTEAGYEPYAHFILPENCWTENYYKFMPTAMESFMEEHAGNKTAEIFVERLKEEIAYYEENKEMFGYVFYIGRKI